MFSGELSQRTTTPAHDARSADVDASERIKVLLKVSGGPSRAASKLTSPGPPGDDG